MVVRVRDGKVLAAGLGRHANHRPVGVLGDVIVMSNGSASGGHGRAATFPKGMVAFRLKAESPDKVTAQALWHHPKGATTYLVHDGLLYASYKGDVTAVDPATGKTLATVNLPARPSAPPPADRRGPGPSG